MVEEEIEMLCSTFFSILTYRDENDNELKFLLLFP